LIEAGHVIAGKYRLDHVLGEAGIGAVWAANGMTPATFYRVFRE